MKPFRSLLFVPGNRPDMAVKAPRSGPDVIVLDLEDSVPTNEKQSARGSALESAALLAEQAPEIAVLVRVNPVSSAHFKADISNALHESIAGIVIPKFEVDQDAKSARDALTKVGRQELKLLAGIESALGIANCETMLDSDMLGAYFGAEDYIADLGGVRSTGNQEVLFARSRVALACRLASIAAIDQIVPVFNDDERFIVDAAQARNLGYRAKMCIHPAQVPLANSAFTPTTIEIERATRLLAAYESGIKDGKAAVNFEGQMIDEPLARQARLVVAAAELRN